MYAEDNISSFMRCYRDYFPTATVLAKMHLGGSCCAGVRKWRIKVGVMEEQGAKSIHTHIAKQESQYSGIANELNRDRYIFKEYNLESAPTLSCLKPAPKSTRSTETIYIAVYFCY